MSKLVRYPDSEGNLHQLGFHCPGCGYGHSFRIAKAKGEPDNVPIWKWNGDMENPTFTPSLLVWGSDKKRRCHLYLKNGQIQFLGDCFHELKGKTVPCQADAP